MSEENAMSECEHDWFYYTDGDGTIDNNHRVCFNCKQLQVVTFRPEWRDIQMQPWHRSPS